MNSCYVCKFYDPSFDACNADENCYMDGYDEGIRKANETIEPTIREIHDGVFAQGKQMGKEEALKDLLEIVYAEQEKQLVEPIDCEECAFNSGLSTMADVIIKVIKEKINEG